jgi:hypothetical protein
VCGRLSEVRVATVKGPAPGNGLRRWFHLASIVHVRCRNDP